MHSQHRSISSSGSRSFWMTVNREEQRRHLYSTLNIYLPYGDTETVAGIEPAKYRFAGGPVSHSGTPSSHFEFR